MQVHIVSHPKAFHIHTGRSGRFTKWSLCGNARIKDSDSSHLGHVMEATCYRCVGIAKHLKIRALDIRVSQI